MGQRKSNLSEQFSQRGNGPCRQAHHRARSTLSCFLQEPFREGTDVKP
jgi:hypothetical protein